MGTMHLVHDAKILIDVFNIKYINYNTFKIDQYNSWPMSNPGCFLAIIRKVFPLQDYCAIG